MCVVRKRVKDGYDSERWQSNRVFFLARILTWEMTCVIDRSAFAPKSYVDAGGEAFVTGYVSFLHLQVYNF